MNITTLGEITLRTYLPVGDESIAIDYKIGVLAEINGDFGAFLETVSDGYEAAAKALAAIEIEVEGAPVACTAEALRAAGVPEQVLWAAIAWVRHEANVGKLGSTRISPPGSSTKTSASAPTGTTS